MNKVEPIDYSRCLMNILKTVHGGQLSIKRNAVNLIALLIDNFNCKLLYCFVTKSLKSKVREGVDFPSFRAVFDAVDEILAEQLKHCALTEADRQVILHRMGVLVFKPAKIKKRPIKPKPVTTRPNVYEYVPSVERVFKLMCPEDQVQRNVTKAIALFAREFSLRLIEKSQQLANGRTVLPAHMKQSVDSSMSRMLAAHANSEAIRHQLMFDQGIVGARLRQPVEIYEALKPCEKVRKNEFSEFSCTSMWSK